jgi:Flp pilus assembly protein TadD
VDQRTLTQVIALYETGKLDEAEKTCRDVLSREPDQLEATYLLGRIQLDRSDAAAAIPLLRRAARLAPDWPEIHANLGAALYMRGKTDEAAHHVRRACALDPDDAEAHNNLGVLLQADGRAKEAEAAFLRALEIRPGYPEAVCNLGATLYSLGRYSDAVERLRQALALDTQNPEVQLALGEACLSVGDLTAAEFEFSRVLDRHPEEKRALDGLERVREAQFRAGSIAECIGAGAQSVDRGEMEAAEAAYRQALSLAPEDDAALKGLALVLLRTGRADQARPILKSLLERRPDDVELLNNLGVALRDLGAQRDAVGYFRKAMEIDPDDRNALANLAYTLAMVGCSEEAIPLCRRALAIWPDSAELYNALAVGLTQQRDTENAVSAYRSALSLNPHLATAWMNLGVAYFRIGQEIKGVRPLRRALAIEPDQVEALNNLGLIYLLRGRYETAEELLRRAIALRPNASDFRLNLAFCLLARERYEEGWQEYEHRLRVPDCAEPKLGAPNWRGESNPSGTLMVYTEQGYGDNIQFIRYLGMVKERWQGRVVYYSCPELYALFKASGLPTEIVSWPTMPYPQEGYDAFVSLMSVPGLFGTVTQTIPARVPYLSAPDDRVEAWRSRIDPGPELKVGLAWAGRRDTHLESRRACDLAQLSPLAGIPGVRYYSLQTGPDARQLERPPEGLEITDLGRDLVDFADTAAIMQHLDLVISIDTAAAHLAGALGRPAWILLPVSPDWRWLTDREDSPWYPTARLFRQQRPMQWEPIWRRVADALQVLALDRRSTG